MTTKEPTKKQLYASMQRHTRKVLSRLKKYDKMSLLERYAIFMGKVQFVELYLRQALANERGYDFEEMERKPLSRIIKLLKKEGANDLIIFLAEDVNSFRNPLAHEFLANHSILFDLLKDKTKEYTWPVRELDRALFSVEQFLLNFEALPEGYIWRNDGKTIHL